MTMLETTRRWRRKLTLGLGATMDRPMKPADPVSTNPTPDPSRPPQTARSQEPTSHLEKELTELKRRLVKEAVSAVGMLEASIAALWLLDKNAASEIRKRDDSIDAEEVAIEERCLRLMALHQPFARDFRILAFILKVNADVERVADHAASIAKIVIRMKRVEPPEWPTPLLEMGQRVPMMCHSALRALLDENAAAAKEVVAADKAIDGLDRQLFEETQEWMINHPDEPEVGLYFNRVGRELERVGDLMGNIAEDIVYLATGQIIRHQKRKSSAPKQP
ncbi:MAG: phosphate signaling complex protein PhoU [Pyrinomonadaceae bacterium]|nr:phosphate signaling complex protein PhoU [Phycisphaerales bacterium]